MTPGSWWGPEKQVFHQSQRSSGKRAAGGGCPLQPPEGTECGAGLGGGLGKGAAAGAVCTPTVATTEAPSKAVSWALYLLRADPSSTSLPHNKPHKAVIAVSHPPLGCEHLVTRTTTAIARGAQASPCTQERRSVHHQPCSTGGETEVSAEEHDPKKGAIPSPLCSTPGGRTIV